MAPPRPLGETERILARQRKVLELRKTGKSIDDIVEALSTSGATISRATVARDIREGLNQLAEDSKLEAVAVRELLTARLDQALKAEGFQEKVLNGDLLAIDRMVKLVDQYARLYGAYAPTKIAQTDPTGEKGVGLTDEERASRVSELLALAEKRQNESQETAE